MKVGNIKNKQPNMLNGRGNEGGGGGGWGLLAKIFIETERSEEHVHL